MKANEFVRQFGISTAKDVLDNADVSRAACFAMITEPRIDYTELKRLVESHELVEKHGGLERVKKVIDGKHIGYTHFYLHSNGRYVFLDHYVDFIPDHAQHIGMFNKAIADVESCQGESV